MNKHPVIKNIFLLIVVIVAFTNTSYADNKPDIQTEKFWIVLAPEVARTTAGYGVIKNNGDEADTLIRISSNVATVMLHKTEIDSGMARMVHMPNIVIEPHSELVFEPMSFHLMFSDLTPAILSEDGEITLLLEFEKSGVIEVKAPILPAWH